MKQNNIKSFVCVLVLLIPHFIFTQVPSIEWQKSFGGSKIDQGNSIQQTKDGGYIFTGTSFSSDGDLINNRGESDFWVVKLDALGSIVWQKSIGGISYDYNPIIQESIDGGYILVGTSYNTDNNADYYAVKLNSTGSIVWERNFGGSDHDIASSFVQTENGLYFRIAGYSLSFDGALGGNYGLEDGWLMRCSILGGLQQSNIYGGTSNDFFNSIQQTKDGGYILIGSTWSNDFDVNGNHGDSDVWVIKLNSNSSIVWQKCLGGTSQESGIDILQSSSDGGYLLAAPTYSKDGDVTEHHGNLLNSDYWIVKLTESGSILWQKTIGGSFTDIPKSILQTDDGHYIIAGESNSKDGEVLGNNGQLDYWIVCLNSTGNILWQKNFGGSKEEKLSSIKQTTDGGYILIGTSSSNDGDVNGNHGESDIWVVKLSKVTGNEDVMSYAPKIYPNPASEAIIVENLLVGAKLTIFDIMGNIKYKTELENSSKTISVVDYQPGTYGIKVEHRGSTKYFKLMVIK